MTPFPLHTREETPIALDKTRTWRNLARRAPNPPPLDQIARWISGLVKFSSDVTARVTFIQSRLRRTLKLFWLAANVGNNDLVIGEAELGKHVRLPFSLSETIVKAPFDIIHSDLWTSPITSVSGLKNMNACSLGGSFDHNKSRCLKRFEDQEQIVVQH
ncbi:hypothetical protein Tco_0261920 [Tanacetum coccineum]